MTPAEAVDAQIEDQIGRATDLLLHYFRQCGLRDTTGDAFAEIRCAVRAIVDASVLEAEARAARKEALR